MNSLNIRIFPDSILRKKASSITKVGKEERDILEEMVKTMYFNQGVGLAAVQVGIDKQLAVIDVGEGPIKLINPVIVKREGEETIEEGCLSVPEVSVKVKRAKSVVVNFLDEQGKAKHLKAEGLLARALQHEIDHLSGMLIIDYLNPFDRIFMKKRLSSQKNRARPEL